MLKNLDLEPDCLYSKTCNFFGTGCKFSQVKSCKPDFKTRLKLAKETSCPIMVALNYQGSSASCQFPIFRARFPGINQCVKDGKCAITNLDPEEQKKVVTENRVYIL